MLNVSHSRKRSYCGAFKPWFRVAFATDIQKVYDYVLTFRLEYHYVWLKQQWSLIQLLFFVNRYMPFVDITLSLYGKRYCYQFTCRSTNI